MFLIVIKTVMYFLYFYKMLTE